MGLAKKVGCDESEWTLSIMDGDGDALNAIVATARSGVEDLLRLAMNTPAFRMGVLHLADCWRRIDALGAALREQHPIPIAAGFEGNHGVEGGVWQIEGAEGDALVHLRFSSGTIDLPLHIHEYSDRLIMVVSGFGLFHFAPVQAPALELRSLVVQPGDVVAFTRGLLHTFTAPVCDLTLFSFHSPFIALDDPRQFTLPGSVISHCVDWRPAGLVTCASASGGNLVSV